MFITINDSEISVVENGIIKEVYDKDESLVDIYTDKAKPIDSDHIGEKAKAENLIRLNCTDDRCVLNHNVGETIMISPDKSGRNIDINEYI